MTDHPRLTRLSEPRHPIGIVHFGPGAFFRAFGAIYTAEVLAGGGGDWGISAVSLQSSRAYDQLAPQGGLYTSVTLDDGGAEHNVVNAISECLLATEDRQRVLARMADPAVKIISLTITEKGYCHAPSSGRLRLDHRDIDHDIRHPHAPRSAIGLIVEALARRRDAGLKPFSVLSCDNLPGNGPMMRDLTLEFAAIRDAELTAWIADEARFPATMVDRITPATTPADIDRLATTTGYRDEACVFHEPFRQWVIEDDFVDHQRPDWDLAGAQFVRDVTAHEMMKLRCLNGTHSTLAYLGYLAGYETIAETVADPAFARLCQRLWSHEVIPTLTRPEGEDLNAYCDALLKRYRNGAIHHRTWQIAMDGSQKLPQRLLGTAMDARSRGINVPGIALAVAGWMRYVGGIDEQGDTIDVRDPLAARLRSLSDSADQPAAKVDALLSVGEVFAPEIAEDREFTDTVRTAYSGLVSRGAKSMVAELAAGFAPSVQGERAG